MRAEVSSWVDFKDYPVPTQLNQVVGLHSQYKVEFILIAGWILLIPPGVYGQDLKT